MPCGSRLLESTKQLAALLVGVLVIAGCSNSTSGNATTKGGGTVVLRILGQWSSFDLQGATDGAQQVIVSATYDRLLELDSTGHQIPYLAKSWVETPTSIKFTLRGDATCSDGTPVTATVVANSLKRLVDPATNSTTVRRVFGPGPYTISADDAARSVTFSLGTPFSDLLSGFADPVTGIVCPAGLANPASLKTQMYGSGPYTLVSAVGGDSVTLKLRREWNWATGTTAKELTANSNHEDYDTTTAAMRSGRTLDSPGS